MADKSQRNLQRLRRVVEDAASIDAEQVESWVERARLATIGVYGTDSDQLRRLDAVRYTPAAWIGGMPADFFDRAALDGVREAVGVLSAFIEDVEEHLVEPDAPVVGTRTLHPWVAEASARLWANGHRQQAVQAAGSVVEQWLRVKLGSHQGSVASLVGSAFSSKDPTPEQPRLRFRGYEPGSDAWTNAHEGAAAFGRGCMMRIRNLYTHNTGADEQEDLEALASLSLLARWIDGSSVERAE